MGLQAPRRPRVATTRCESPPTTSCPTQPRDRRRAARSRHGVELQRDGARIRGVCPFHPDDGRSLVIDSKRNTWRCESGCAEGGSAVEWVQKAREISRHRAAGCASVEHLLGTPPATKALATISPINLSLGSGIAPMFAWESRVGCRLDSIARSAALQMLYTQAAGAASELGGRRTRKKLLNRAGVWAIAMTDGSARGARSRSSGLAGDSRQARRRPGLTCFRRNPRERSRPSSGPWRSRFRRRSWPSAQSG